jgi:hypothetical protein
MEENWLMDLMIGGQFKCSAPLAAEFNRMEDEMVKLICNSATTPHICHLPRLKEVGKGVLSRP